jgi:hypothetical protein
MRMLTTALLASVSLASFALPAAPAAGHDRVARSTDLGTGVYGLCWDGAGSWSCTVAADLGGSRSFHGPSRLVGDTFVNCTRETVRQERPVTVERDGTAEFTGGSTQRGLRRPARFTWSEDAYRSVTETVGPREVSWVEVQPARASGSGSFTVTDGDGRAQVLTGSFEGPSPTLSDRFYQRTGPMTETEQESCRSPRPTG